MGVEHSINVTEYYDSNKLSSADLKNEIVFSKKNTVNLVGPISRIDALKITI